MREAKEKMAGRDSRGSRSEATTTGGGGQD